MIIYKVQIIILGLLLASSSWAIDRITFSLATQNNASINNYALEYMSSRFLDKDLEEKRIKLIDLFMSLESPLNLKQLITEEMLQDFLNHPGIQDLLRSIINNDEDYESYKESVFKLYTTQSTRVSSQALLLSNVKISMINKTYGSKTVNSSIQNLKNLAEFLGQETIPSNQPEFSKLVLDRVLHHMNENKDLILTDLKKSYLIADSQGTHGLTRLFYYVVFEVDAFTKLFLGDAFADYFSVINAYEKTPMGNTVLKSLNLAQQVQANDIIALTETDLGTSNHLVSTYQKSLIGDHEGSFGGDSRLYINLNVFPISSRIEFSLEDQNQTTQRFEYLKTPILSYLPEIETKFLGSPRDLSFARLEDQEKHSFYVASLHAGSSGVDSIGSIAMLATKYRQESQSEPAVLIIAGDFNINLKESGETDKLLTQDLENAIHSISQKLDLICRVSLPSQNTVDKTRAWTTQLDKVGKMDRASRDGFIFCIKNELENRMTLEIGELSVGPMGVSEENASDHARVATQVTVIYNSKINEEDVKVELSKQN